MVINLQLLHPTACLQGRDWSKKCCMLLGNPVCLFVFPMGLPFAGDVCALRCSLLALLILCCGGCLLIENPENSLINLHCKFKWLARVFKRTGLPVTLLHCFVCEIVSWHFQLKRQQLKTEESILKKFTWGGFQLPALKLSCSDALFGWSTTTAKPRSEPDCGVVPGRWLYLADMVSSVVVERKALFALPKFTLTRKANVDTLHRKSWRTPRALMKLGNSSSFHHCIIGGGSPNPKWFLIMPNGLARIYTPSFAAEVLRFRRSLQREQTKFPPVIGSKHF